eukprot:UN03277
MKQELGLVSDDWENLVLLYKAVHSGALRPQTPHLLQQQQQQILAAQQNGQSPQQIQIPNWELDCTQTTLLGSGSFGRIYKVVDYYTRKPYCVKICDQPPPPDPRSSEEEQRKAKLATNQFLREIEIAKFLHLQDTALRKQSAQQEQLQRQQQQQQNQQHNPNQQLQRTQQQQQQQGVVQFRNIGKGLHVGLLQQYGTYIDQKHCKAFLVSEFIPQHPQLTNSLAASELQYDAACLVQYNTLLYHAFSISQIQDIVVQLAYSVQILHQLYCCAS